MVTVTIKTPKLDGIDKELEYLRTHVCIVGILSDDTEDGVKIIDYAVKIRRPFR